MDPRTVKFIVFALFGLASLWAGRSCRKRGLVHEDASRRVHFHTIAWIWSAAAFLSLWYAPLELANLWLVAIQAVIVIVAGFAGIGVAHLARCPRGQIGVLAVGSGVGNLGFTLGAYICYSLLDPAQTALGVAIAYVSVMQIVSVVVMYPVARHYGQGPGTSQSLARMLAANLVDLRSLPLYTAVLGQILGQYDISPPAWFARVHLIDILFYLGAFGGYFGIGLRLRISDSRRFLKQHALLAGMKFLFIPALSFLLLAVVDLSPWPLSDVARNVVLVQAFMPTAIQTVMLANLFDMDSRLASSVWLWNTLLFFVGPLGLILWIWG